MKNCIRQIGAHVSKSGGLDKAVERAIKLRANCLQLFSGSPRVWKRKKIDNVDTKKYYSKVKENNFKSVFTHALYLINLGSEKQELVNKSINALIYDLKFDSHINGSGVVVHLGSHLGQGWNKVKQNLVDRIKDILNQSPVDCHLLIENAAGTGGKLNADLSEIRWLLDQINDERLGWCFDTCHAYAMGYYFGKKTPSKNLDLGKSAIDEINKLDLWSSLKIIHVNDSMTEFNSHKDRHENLGEGKISLDDFRYFFNLDQVETIPLVLEVPGFDGNGPDKKNIDKLKELVGV